MTVNNESIISIILYVSIDLIKLQYWHTVLRINGICEFTYSVNGTAMSTKQTVRMAGCHASKQSAYSIIEGNGMLQKLCYTNSQSL